MFIIPQKQQKNKRKAPYIPKAKAGGFTALVGKKDLSLYLFAKHCGSFSN